MADTGQRIAALRAYVVDGQGGADYMDRDENHWIVQQIATPMSIYPPYKATRTSFGINALKTLVIELEADDGTVGFGITTGGYPAAWLAVNHLNRFVVGKKVEEIEIMWDQMFKASLYYGRKGIVMNTISAIDLAAWDLLGRIRKEPVHAMIGGKVRDELEFYATGPRPDIAKELGVLTVGVVTKPFRFEGMRRMKQAEGGITELRNKVDSLVIIPNERLKFATDQKITMVNAFEIADDVLQQAVQSISDLIKNTGFINLDFADVTAVMKDAGMAHMGVGRAAGKNKAEEAAKMAISSPLLETSINGAHGVLVNVTGSMDIGLEEVETAANLVQQAAHPDALIIFGAAFDEELEDEIRVTVISTGFEEGKNGGMPQNPFSAGKEAAVSQQAAERGGAERVAPPDPLDEDPFVDIFKIFNKDK